jgi:hypothetical protein
MGKGDYSTAYVLIVVSHVLRADANRSFSLRALGALCEISGKWHRQILMGYHNSKTLGALCEITTSWK